MSETLGARIRRVRESKNISQAQLSRITGMEQTAVSRIEVGKSGKTYNPSCIVLYKIAKALGTTSDALLEGLVTLKPVAPVAPAMPAGLAERLGNELTDVKMAQMELAKNVGQITAALEKVVERLDAERPKARR